MREPYYEPLSVLDQTFLAFETPNAYMHVAATVLIDGARLRGPDGAPDLQLLKAYVASRLPLIPAYRRCLASIPFESRPVWVDDHKFHIDNHIKMSTLPPPGGPRQLQRRCEELLERPLNRHRPLWEIWVIDGLERGRITLLCKVHHCMVDGLSGVALLTALFQLSPERTIPQAGRWMPRPVPTGAELVRDEIRRRVRRSMALLSSLPALLREPTDTARQARERFGGLVGFLRSGLQPRMDTPMNAPIGPHRRVAFADCSLADVKAIKAVLGGTVNDVVLATVSGAVRRLLERRGGTPQQGAFRVAVPVNTRDVADRGSSLGNHVWAWIVNLPVREADPVHALQLIVEETRSLKQTTQASSGEILTEAVEWTSARLIPLGARLISRAQPSLIVTNVPGPPMPLFVLDAVVEAIYPHVPLFEQQGLGIALFSYSNQLFWGLTGDWDLLADIDEVADDIRACFRQLLAAAHAATPASAVARSLRQARRPSRQRPGPVASTLVRLAVD